AGAGIDEAAARKADEAEPGLAEEREIREEVQRVALSPELRVDPLLVVRRVPVLEIDELAVRASAFGRVERPEAAQLARLDGAERDLSGRVPVRVVDLRRHRELVARVRVERELREEVVPPEVLRLLVIAVRGVDLRGEER